MTPADLFADGELERYERQIRLDGFGLEAQRRLKGATVLVSRVGGVGGTIALGLAKAGVGKLVLAHGGTLSAEYMNRMLLADPADVGRPCMEVFVERLRRVNPQLEVVGVAENVSADNVAGLVAQADLVADGAPLFEERYLMNAEAVRQGKPLVVGAMYGTEGYVTVILPGSTPCLACIYPARPDYWTNIKVFPAIGPAPWVVGATATMEAVKVLTGFGEPLAGILWSFDLETNLTRKLRVHRNPECPVCGGLGAGEETPQ